MSSFTPPAGSLHEFVDGSAFSRICAGLLATSAIRSIISHRLDSGRVGISTFSLAHYRRITFLRVISREIIYRLVNLCEELPHPRPHQQLPKKQAPVVWDDTHTTGAIQMGAMPTQQLHERNQAPSRSSICGTDFLPNSMVCCAPGRVITMHGTLITLNLSLSSGKCAIS